MLEVGSETVKIPVVDGVPQFFIQDTVFPESVPFGFRALCELSSDRQRTEHSGICLKLHRDRAPVDVSRVLADVTSAAGELWQMKVGESLMQFEFV